MRDTTAIRWSRPRTPPEGDVRRFLNRLRALRGTTPKTYVSWLGQRTGKRYRLPSEAEWEYAARAGTTTPFHTRRQITPKQANYDGNYPYAGGVKGGDREKTLPVGSFPPNAWGLHDVHGNVWEWLQDSWHASYAGAPLGGSAWEDGDGSVRVVRGGSWNDYARDLRSAYRLRRGTGVRSVYVGFRVARTLP